MTDSVIEEDLTVEGNIVAKDSGVTIKGRISGDVSAKDVIVAPGGHITGKVDGTNVSVSGTISGTVSCEDLTLEQTATVEADVVSGSLSSKKGARLKGKAEVKGT